MADALSLAFRAVSFVLVLNAAGIPIFVVIFGRLGSNTATAQLGWKLALAALGFVAAHHVLEAARMAGEMSGVVDPSMQAMALHSSAGAAFAMRVAGLVLIAVGLRRPGQLPIALAGTGLTVASFTMTGHTSVNPHRTAASALLTLHLLMVAFWMGALWPLYLTARNDSGAIAARLIDAFSRVAVWLVPVILLAGAGLAALLLPNFSALRLPYGQLLLAKVASFALLMALAAVNKWRLGPACAAGETRAFRQSVVIEYAVICIVLAITATMTMFYSPEPEGP